MKNDKNFEYPLYRPVTQETIDKLVKNGIIDEMVDLVDPDKNDWRAVDRSEEVLKRWNLK